VRCAYGLSKGVILAFTNATAIELSCYGVTANAILPIYILTPMVWRAAEQSNPANPQTVLGGIATGVLMDRLGDPREIRLSHRFLASAKAAYMTGGEFIIDGGTCLPEINTMGLSK